MRQPIKAVVSVVVFFLITVLSHAVLAQTKPQDTDLPAVQHRLQEEQRVRRIVNATMDIILEGDWFGRFPDPGGRTDPLYIACMVRNCAAVRAAFPNDGGRWRDHRHFAQCYAEHAERVKRTDYVPLAFPPPITSLGCGLIESQRRTQDDRVYVAVNGHARPQTLQRAPTPIASAPAHKGSSVTADDLKELEVLAAQYDGGTPSASASASPPPPPAMASAAPTKDDNPYVDEPPAKRPAPQPKAATHVASPAQAPIASSGNGFGGLGDKLQLLYANDDEAAIHVLPGGQFYTIRGSWLSKKYDTEWKTSRKHAKAMNKQFIGACFNGKSVRLDGERMHLHPWSYAELNAPPDDKFVEECEKSGGEYRFALQAGETIRLSARSKVGMRDDAPVTRTQPAENENPPNVPAPAPTAQNDAPPTAVDSAVPSIATSVAPQLETSPIPSCNDQSGAPTVDAGQASTPIQPDATSVNDPLGRAFGHDRTPRFAMMPEGKRQIPPPAMYPPSGSMNERLPAEMNEGHGPSENAGEAYAANGRSNQSDSQRFVDPFPK